MGNCVRDQESGVYIQGTTHAFKLILLHGRGTVCFRSGFPCHIYFKIISPPLSLLRYILREWFTHGFEWTTVQSRGFYGTHFALLQIWGNVFFFVWNIWEKSGKSPITPNIKYICALVRKWKCLSTFPGRVLKLKIRRPSIRAESWQELCLAKSLLSTCVNLILNNNSLS